jgi:hypothetical protein
MRFLFERRDYLVETLDVGGANVMGNSAFQCRQMTLDALRQLSPFCRWSHDERAAICFADCARDQPAPCQAIENAGQGRSLVREAAMELGHFGPVGTSEQR